VSEGKTGGIVDGDEEVLPARFGFVDSRPLNAPQPAEGVGSYLSKYLAKWQPDGTMEVTETVRSAGRSLLSYVSRKLTAKSGVTMRAPGRACRLGLAGRADPGPGGRSVPAAGCALPPRAAERTRSRAIAPAAEPSHLPQAEAGVAAGA
jgi:hypothetical protein